MEQMEAERLGGRGGTKTGYVVHSRMRWENYRIQVTLEFFAKALKGHRYQLKFLPFPKDRGHFFSVTSVNNIHYRRFTLCLQNACLLHYFSFSNSQMFLKFLFLLFLFFPAHEGRECESSHFLVRRTRTQKICRQERGN